MRRLHRLALRAYPRGFRAEFGAELERVFDARIAAARRQSIWRAAGLSLFLTFDAVSSGLAERRRGPERHHEGRQTRSVMSWESLISDLRLAVRHFVRAPVFALVTVLTLGLGIGANSAIFGVVHAVLLRPLPYGAPDDLVAIWSDNSRQGEPNNPVSPANFEAFRAAPSIAAAEAMYSFLTPPQLVINGGDPEVVAAATITPGMMDLLGRAPLHGRPFRSDDREPSLLLSHDYWQRRFGGDPNVVGRTITAIGMPAPFTIAGVMPPDFVFPYRSMLGPSGFSRAQTADVWIPLVPQGDARLRDPTGQPNRNLHYLSVIARLRPGATIEMARTELAAIAVDRARTFPDSNTGWGVTVRPLHEQAVGRLRPALMTLLAGVGVVLLITCINVANVLLARAAGRQRDLAVRSALGASRRRLVQQMLVESLALGVAGGLAGVLLMIGATQAILALAPPQLPRLGEVSATVPVLVFAAAMSLLTGIAVGLLPALSASRSRASDSLRESQRTTASASRQRIRSALIVAEVAMAMALTAGAGLLLRSFASVLAVDPGFRAEHLLTFQMSVPTRLQNSGPAVVEFYDDLERRLTALPGVAALGGTTRLPLGSTSVTTYIEVEGRATPRAELPEVEFRRSVFDYFGAMGIPIVNGRGFTRQDGGGAQAVALVNSALAARVFPGEDPVGRRIRPTNSQWLTIVGVVGSIRHGSLEETPRPELYLNYRQGPPVSPFVAIRTSADPSTLAAAVRQVFRDVGADPPRDLRTMDDLRSASVGERRFVLILVGVFGALALALAGVGVFGVVTLIAAERTAEVGIRLALGATPMEVLRLVVSHALRLALAGIAIGTVAAILVAPALGSQLFGIGRADPATYIIVAGALLAVAAIAALVPARRAMKIEPATTLRAESR
jgi:predicted permease